MTAATITMYTASYRLTDGRVRPVEIAVVRRKRDGRTTRVRVIDAGAATALAAHQAALHFAGDRGEVVCVVVDHGDLGLYDLTDDGRDQMLAAVRGLDLGIGAVGTDPTWGGAWAGAAPLDVQTSAVHGDRP